MTFDPKKTSEYPVSNTIGMNDRLLFIYNANLTSRSTRTITANNFIAYLNLASNVVSGANLDVITDADEITSFDNNNTTFVIWDTDAEEWQRTQYHTLAEEISYYTLSHVANSTDYPSMISVFGVNSSAEPKIYNFASLLSNKFSNFSNVTPQTGRFLIGVDEPGDGSLIKIDSETFIQPFSLANVELVLGDAMNTPPGIVAGFEDLQSNIGVLLVNEDGGLRTSPLTDFGTFALVGTDPTGQRILGIFDAETFTQASSVLACYGDEYPYIPYYVGATVLNFTQHAVGGFLVGKTNTDTFVTDFYFNITPTNCMQLHSDMKIQWTNGDAVTGTLANTRPMLKYYAGSVNQLQVRTANDDADYPLSCKMVINPAINFALLPDPTTCRGARTMVSDANIALSFGEIVLIGGGGNAAPVYSDGTNWRMG